MARDQDGGGADYLCLQLRFGKYLPQNQLPRCYTGWKAKKESLRKENP